MATWYAQTNNASINAANLWNSLATGLGTWLTWPPPVGDTLNINGRTRIAINTNVTCDTMTTAGGSGYFTIGQAVTLTANLISGNVSGFRVDSGSGFTVTINGNVTGASAACINISVAATVTVTGNVLGGSGATGYGITTSSATSTINVVGNVMGGSNAGAHGISLNVAAPINVTGDVVAATGRGVSGGNGTILKVTNGSVQDTATVSAFYGVHFQFNPGPTNYMRVRTGDGTTTRDYYYTPTDTEIASAVWTYASRTLTA